MEFSIAVKNLRKKCFLSQEDFAKAIGVSYSTVNRWETGKTKPNYKAMRCIDDYCKNNTVDFNIGNELLEEKND